MIQFNPPTVLQGTEAGKIAGLYSYLHRMSEQLNVALRSIGPENFQDPALKELAVNAAEVQTAKQAAEGYSEIKSLIVKTADTINLAMDALVERFASTYVASNDFGEFEQNLEQTITTTAESVLQQFKFDENITILDQLANVTNYQLDSNQYIKTGLLYFENVGGIDIPRYGVAVGEDLTTVTVTVDGVNYEVVNRSKLMATYTSNALTFWHNNIKVAWVTDDQLFINEINLVKKMTLGGKWQIDHRYGFTVKWVG